MICFLDYADVRFHPRPFHVSKPKVNINIKKGDIKFSAHDAFPAWPLLIDVVLIFRNVKDILTIS